MSKYNLPWKEIITDDGFIIEDSKGYVIASHRPGKEFVNIDNARILAVAPEMLDILIRLYGFKEMFPQQAINNILNKVIK